MQTQAGGFGPTRDDRPGHVRRPPDHDSAPRAARAASGHAGLLDLQRRAGNRAVAGLISEPRAQGLVVQRKTVTQINITAELGSNAEFRSLVAAVENGGPAQTTKLGEAFTAACADPAEDPAKLVAAMDIAWIPLLTAIRAKKTPAARLAETAWRKAKADVTKMSLDRAAELVAKQRDEAAASESAALNKVHANLYWDQIQAQGVGTAEFGAPLEFLRVQKFVTIERPHRAFLSSWEKSGGVRDNGKFGLSAVLTPNADIARPGPVLVLHMHCNKDGKVRSAGIKYRDVERAAGANVVLENLAFLTLGFGVTGENVETEIAPFD